MIIECTSCHSKYQYDEERFERKPSKKIKCAKCQQVFEIFNPAAAAPARPVPPATEAGDQTFHRKESRLKLDPDPPSATAETPAASSATGKHSPALLMPAGKRLSLAVIDGPDAGNVFRIERPRVTVGRTGADLVLNDTEASRQHAAVEIHDTTYMLVDLGSTNGTLVNGEKITEPFELLNQSEFVVGVSTVMLIVTEDV